MKKLIQFLGVSAGGLFLLVQTANALSFGPGATAYLTQSDSPFSSLSFSTFYFEDFEDGLLNTLGVSISAGSVIGPFQGNDSVDDDSGPIDGSGSSGRNLFSSNGGAGITFTFSAAALGGLLPTHVGIVWTDGAGTIQFGAFGPGNVPLGTISGTHADGGTSGTTGEDRFYGFSDAGGISSFTISNSSGGIEVDHLQYGFASVTAPIPGNGTVPESISTFAGLVSCLLGLLAMRRRFGR